MGGQISEVRLTSQAIEQVQRDVASVAATFAAQRDERATRTGLVAEDFAHLADAGFLRVGVPQARGGLWRGIRASVRDYASLIRTLGRADPSVALVAAMHPSVLSFWLAASDIDDVALKTQAECNFERALEGHWWGTITSEPGSGGDPMRTRAEAERAGNDWCITGAKHFASGSSIASFMITTARVSGEPRPDLYTIDMRQRPWDGSEGLALARQWDGHGMMATDSHAFNLKKCPAERAAGRDLFSTSAPVVGQLTPLLFAAVILGILDVAVERARAVVGSRLDSLRPYEQVTWSQTSNGIWLAEQAYEGAMRTVETGTGGLLAAARAKLTIAELAESSLSSLARVMGGASFARSQPFGQWAQDVRALGFLRPPWGYAYDQLIGFEFSNQSA